MAFFRSPMDEYTVVRAPPGLGVRGKLLNTYHHPQRDIDPVVHGDDFVAVAEDGQLDHFEQVLENSMEIKRVGRIGPWSLQHRQSAQARRQLEWRWLHIGGESKVDGEAAQHAELEEERER